MENEGWELNRENFNKLSNKQIFAVSFVISSIFYMVALPSTGTPFTLNGYLIGTVLGSIVPFSLIKIVQLVSRGKIEFS